MEEWQEWEELRDIPTMALRGKTTPWSTGRAAAQRARFVPTPNNICMYRVKTGPVIDQHVGNVDTNTYTFQPSM